VSADAATATTPCNCRSTALDSDELVRRTRRYKALAPTGMIDP
jgi:hypothetical protein